MEKFEASSLIEFEREVAEHFAKAKIHSPVHFSGGNEEQAIWVFDKIGPADWVFSTWRSHYHALLSGVPREKVMKAILDGKSMNMNFPEHRFVSSAIVGGTLPIACGVAAGIKRSGGQERVWCFIGDMCASIGAFRDAQRYADGHALPITFVIEDNGLATNTPTWKTWGESETVCPVIRYGYKRTYPHVGLTQRVEF